MTRALQPLLMLLGLPYELIVALLMRAACMLSHAESCGGGVFFHRNLAWPGRSHGPARTGAIISLMVSTPTQYGRSMHATFGTQLRQLLLLLDGEVEGAYRDAGLDYRPSYTPVMRALMASGPLTMGAMATAAGITHSVAAQSVALMVKDNLVAAESASAAGLPRLISLTPEGKKMAATLKDFWRAIAIAAASLEADLPYSLSAVLASAIEALADKPFSSRIREAQMQMQRYNFFQPRRNTT